MENTWNIRDRVRRLGKACVVLENNFSFSLAEIELLGYPSEPSETVTQKNAEIRLSDFDSSAQYNVS